MIWVLLIYIIGMFVTAFGSAYYILWDYEQKTLDKFDTELIGALALCWPLVIPVAAPILVAKIVGRIVTSYINKRAKNA